MEDGELEGGRLVLLNGVEADAASSPPTPAAAFLPVLIDTLMRHRAMAYKNE